MIEDTREALHKLREKLKGTDDIKLLDEIEEELQANEDTIEGLESKCAMYDYWRSNVFKQDKILDVLKRCPFVLEKIFEDENKHDEYNKAYFWGTITDEELKVVKEWLEL